MIYYLVQGEAYQYADRMAEMADSGAEVIFLTWDKKIDGALFLPNSTWAQGRNFLIKHVIDNNYNFDYLVLMDGDAKPIKGSWQEFNSFLLNKKPQVCVPLMLGTKTFLHGIIERFNLPVPIPSYQKAFVLDNQVEAIRKDVIIAVKDIIYPTFFEDTAWGCNGDLSLCILKYITFNNIVQFNDIEIENKTHRKYPHEYDVNIYGSYINKLDLKSLFPLFQYKTCSNVTIGRLKKILNCFIELFFLIPFQIKEINISERLEHVKACLIKNNIPNIKKQQAYKKI